MANVRVQNNHSLVEILEDAVAEHSRLVLSCGGSEGWRTFGATFLSGSIEARALRLKVRSPDDEAESLTPDLDEPVGVSFRVGHKKYMFSTVIDSATEEGDHVIVGVRWPEQCKQLRRRAFERAAPPGNTVVAVRLWQVQSDNTARVIQHGQLEDLSAGGMRVHISNPTAFDMASTYHCSFLPKPDKPPIMVDAIVRHREAVGRGRGRIGLQFVGLETTAEGRRVLDRLTRIVQQYQRGQSRKRC